MPACIALPAIRVRLPEFEPTPTKVSHKKGDKARLYCSVKHLGERTVVWRKISAKGPLTIGTKTWINDPRMSVDHSDSESHWDLVIHDVTLDDAGEYECQISVSKTILRHVVDLSVEETSSSQVKRNPEIHISGTHYLNSGEVISLYCNATLGGDKQDKELVWFKDMEEVDEEDDRISLSQDTSPSREYVSSHLRVQSAQPDDSGIYTCRFHEETLMTSAHVSVLTGGSNNVKRAGHVTGPPESNAVLSVQLASTNTVYIVLILFVHRLLT